MPEPSDRRPGFRNEAVFLHFLEKRIQGKQSALIQCVFGGYVALPLHVVDEEAGSGCRLGT